VSCCWRAGAEAGLGGPQRPTSSCRYVSGAVRRHPLPATMGFGGVESVGTAAARWECGQRITSFFDTTGAPSSSQSREKLWRHRWISTSRATRSRTRTRPRARETLGYAHARERRSGTLHIQGRPPMASEVQKVGSLPGSSIITRDTQGNGQPKAS